MHIGNFNLDSDILIVAEIGNNHEGNPDVALKMVDAAGEAGVSAVKVQVIDPERLVNRSQKERIAQLSKFRLSTSTITEMSKRARARGMLFLASAFDMQSLDDVSPLVDAVKIASGDLDFEPLLSRAAAIGKPVILSTGMSTMQDIRNSVGVISAHLPQGRTLKDSLILLHCVGLYPVPADKANLRAMETLQNEFQLTVGYSDHALGIEVAVVAMSLGARLIEKHFTLDKTQISFRDHSLSADPSDMNRLAGIAHAWQGLLGDGKKEISAEEQAMAAVARRSIVAARDLQKGDKLAIDDLEYVRPRNGLLPADAGRLVGRTLRVPLKRHDLVLEEHFG